MIKTDNAREVIQERLAAWLDILKDNGAITFKRGGKPLVRIVGSLYARDERGVIVELNPFAPKGKILKAVIRTLRSHGTIFVRRDLLDPKRTKALKLRKEGKKLKEIASILSPKQFRTHEKKFEKEKTVNKKSRLTATMEKITASKKIQAISCPRYNECLNKAAKDNLLMMCSSCRNAEGVFIKEGALSGVKRKSRTNPIIIKVHRLLKK